MSTPLEAIHKFCVACVGSPFEVKDCGGGKCLNGGCVISGECLFYKFRLGKGRPSVKLIHRYCRYCMGSGPDSRKLVEDCHADGSVKAAIACTLHPFRMGHNPNISDETRAKRREVGKRLGFRQYLPPEAGAVPQIRP